MTQEQYFRFLLFAIMAFELPKPFFWMMENKPYHIFPQFGGSMTDSDIIWMFCHQLTAIVLVLHSIYRWDKNWNAQCALHYLFLFFVAANLFRLFHCTPNVAFGINITLCLALEYYKQIETRFHYIFVLSLPLLFGPVVFLHFLISHRLSMYPICMSIYIGCSAIVSQWIEQKIMKRSIESSLINSIGL